MIDMIFSFSSLSLFSVSG